MRASVLLVLATLSLTDAWNQSASTWGVNVSGEVSSCAIVKGDDSASDNVSDSEGESGLARGGVALGNYTDSAVQSALVQLLKGADSDTCQGTEEGSCETELDPREVRLSQHLFKALPPFVVTSPRVTNQKCLRDSRIFLQDLSRLSTWALRMFDSTAKLPSGLLSGNVIQFGDYDQCLRVDSGPRTHIRGKYCLASLHVTVSEELGRLQQLHDLAHAHFMFTSTFEDSGHRVPRFSSVQWALCVPASCHADDVHVELERVVREQLGAETGLQVRVKVDPAMCVVQQGWEAVPFTSLAAGAFFLSVVVLVVLSTLYGETVGGATPGKGVQLFRAFSLVKNAATLFDVSTTGDEVSSAHGIRLINAFMLLLCHKSMALVFNPYINRTAMAELLAEPWTVIGRGAALYTDPFIMLSGLLTSYSFIRQLDRTGRLNLPQELASRMFRLVPNLAAIILFCTLLLPFLGSGPQWNLVVNEHANLCANSWWRNLLFVHNYFGFENMCLTHTHHLGIDTQLFVLSPLLVYLVWRWPKVGGAIVVAVAAFSTHLRYHVTFGKQLSLFVAFGTSVSQMFRTANLSYIIPSHRLTVYILGIFLGFTLRHCGRQYKIKRLHLALGWTLAGLFLYLSVFEPARMGLLTYAYSPIDAANYAAFAPIMFTLLFAWVIFVSHTGNGGAIGRLLAWPGFKVTTRLSYAIYLTQFPIFFYNVGRTRGAEQYSSFMLLNLPETMFIIFASMLLTLAFELPFQNIRSILINKR